MFRVVSSNAAKDDAITLADWAGRQDRCALRYPAAYGRGRLFRTLVDRLQAERPQTTFLRIARAPDRIERAILEIASVLNTKERTEVAAELRSEPEGLENTLEKLSLAIGDHSFIVDGWSFLQSSEEPYDVGHALAPRIDAFRTWLSERAWVVADSELQLPAGFAHRAISIDPMVAPSELANGDTYPRPDLWQRFAPDVGAFEAALAMLALEEKPEGRVVPPAWKLNEHVTQRLPDRARQLLYVLGIHGRVLSRALATQLEVEGPAVEQLTQIGICSLDAAGLLIDPMWSHWCQESVAEQLPIIHTRLAKAFATVATPDDADLDSSAIDALEAHRHYLALGDFEAARRFARYGTASLIDEAQRRSSQGKYGEACRLYQTVLDLGASGQLSFGARVRSYANHYVHFNRAKEDAESLKDTERGYVASINDWPENALFWSRLVRTRFYRGATAEALATLNEAKAAVPQHDQKETVLIARTVRGLLRRHLSARSRGHLVDAILVWDDYHPQSVYSRGVEERLERTLARGWESRDLALPGTPPVVFTGPQRVRVVRTAEWWTAELIDLRVQKRGHTARAALEALAAGVRAEGLRLLSALTHSLDPQGRLRKQILMGAIDVVASELDARALEEVWIIGDVVREADDSLWIKTHGTRNLVFAVPEHLRATTPVNDVPRLALVKTGPSGVPIGPVVALQLAYGSADEVWESWVRKTHDG